MPTAPMTVSTDDLGSRPVPEVMVPSPPSTQFSESASGPASPDIPRRACLPLFSLLVIVAALLRVWATHNDLWLDELISLHLAQSVKTPWQIFTAIHNDNNHYLNTLALYFLNESPGNPLIRCFSVLWGIALVPAGYWLLSYRSKVEAVILAGLLACSYPLVHISSEARGYSGALLGCMLACAALVRWLDNEKRPSLFLGLLYGLAFCFAFLSHLTSCLIWLPLLVASLVVVAKRSKRFKWLALWTAINVVPAATLAALYFLDLRFMKQLGGPPMSVLHGLSRLLALGMGWPAKDAVTVWIVFLPLFALIAWQIAIEHSSGGALPMLLAPVYLVPLVCVFLLDPAFFSPRYFVVIVPFIYVYGAILLARLIASPAKRVALGALLSLFLTGQMQAYSRFLRVGRGQFTAALNYISTHTNSPEISLASNQDFRSSVELGYYAPRVLKGQQILFYVTRDDRTFVKPDWYILHEEGSDPPGPVVLNALGHPTWQRVAYFGASELSGQAWTIYRRLPLE